MIGRYKIGMRSDGDYDYEMYVLSCDYCGTTYGNDECSPIITFDGVVKLKKDLKFKSIRGKGGTWMEFCPECYKKLKEEGKI